MIKLAVVGTGDIAQTHARAIQQLGTCELVALVNHRTESMQAFGEVFSVPVSRHYVTIEALINAGDVDAIIICTPNFLHASQSIMALTTGIHVLVEKPMAMTANEAQMILDAHTKSDAVLQVAHCWRFDEEVQFMRDQIASGIIGNVIRTKGYSAHVNWGPSGWFTQKALAGGGALADMGIHAIDTVRFLLGDPKPISVYATIGTYYGDYDVDDTGIITVTWDNDITSTIEFGWWQPHSDGIGASTQFYSTGGFAQLFPTTIQITDSTTRQLTTIETDYPAKRDPHVPLSIYINQIDHFVNCIQSRQTPIADGHVGFVNMQIVSAAYQSSKLNQVINI